MVQRQDFGKILVCVLDENKICLGVREKECFKRNKHTNAHAQKSPQHIELFLLNLKAVTSILALYFGNETVWTDKTYFNWVRGTYILKNYLYSSCECIYLCFFYFNRL